MSGFPSGSAWAMARDVGNGYLLMTERSIARFSVVQLDQLSVEIEKQLREARGNQPDLSDIEALRDRNRRIQRLTTAQRIVRAVRSKRRA